MQNRNFFGVDDLGEKFDSSMQDQLKKNRKRKKYAIIIKYTYSRNIYPCKKIPQISSI